MERLLRSIGKLRWRRSGRVLRHQKTQSRQAGPIPGAPWYIVLTVSLSSFPISSN